MTRSPNRFGTGSDRTLGGCFSPIFLPNGTHFAIRLLMVVCDFSGKTNEFASEVIQQMSRAKGWADKSFEVMGRSVACAIGLRLAEDKSWCSSFGTVPLTTDASRERTVVLTGQENPPFSCRASSCNFPFEGACIAAHHTLQKVNAFNEPSRTSLLQRFRGAALFVRVNG